MMAASFKNVVEAYQIGFDIGIRVGDGVADTSLCCKVYNNSYFVLGEDFIYGSFVCYRVFNESPVSIESSNLRETLFFDIYIIVIGH